jgi:hypothetical protein
VVCFTKFGSCPCMLCCSRVLALRGRFVSTGHSRPVDFEFALPRPLDSASAAIIRSSSHNLEPLSFWAVVAAHKSFGGEVLYDPALPSATLPLLPRAIGSNVFGSECEQVRNATSWFVRRKTTCLDPIGDHTTCMGKPCCGTPPLRRHDNMQRLGAKERARRDRSPVTIE